MRVCEICGQEEEMENGSENNQRRILHVCENCQNDRRHE
jgi:ribosome-binding protein aMBF1 (putative translation factor)